MPLGLASIETEYGTTASASSVGLQVFSAGKAEPHSSEWGIEERRCRKAKRV